MTRRLLDARINRRGALKGIGAAAIVSALSGREAAAQAGRRVVVGTWGGDYQNLLTQHIADPILRPQGIETLWDVGNEPPRKTKMLAERRLPRGTVDIQCLSGPAGFEMNQAGALEPIDWSKIRDNGNTIVPEVKTTYSIPHIFTGRVILYNPSKITTPPTSYNDLWNPAIANKVGIIDIQYQTTLESAALIAGGSRSNYEPGKAKLLELRRMGAQIVPTNEAMAQALKNEEIWMCIMWKARGVMWQNAGVPIQMAAPREGVGLYISEFCIAKNAPNKDAAYAFVNASLEASAQTGFARSMGYNGSNRTVTYPEDIRSRIAFTPEEQANMIMPDYEYLARNDAQIRDWWDRVFKA